MRGPVLDLHLREAAAGHVIDLDKMVGLGRAAVGALAIPVLGALAVDDRPSETSYLGVGSFDNNGRVAGVGRILNCHCASKQESTAGRHCNRQGARGGDGNAAQQDVGTS